MDSLRMAHDDVIDSGIGSLLPLQPQISIVWSTVVQSPASRSFASSNINEMMVRFSGFVSTMTLYFLCRRSLALSMGPSKGGFFRHVTSFFGAGVVQNDASTDAGTSVKSRPFSSAVKPDGEDPDIEKLFVANREWVDSVNAEDPTFFQKQAKGQAPKFLYIGCSDSRVAISKLIGVEMGQVFVHRNIANMVVSSDLNLLAVLTYAVEHLNVKHILVTGHYDCGGVRAAVKKQGLGQVLNAWLQNIRDVYRIHKTELDSIKDEEARHRRLVELNVQEQCLNLYKTSVVQRKRLDTHANPRVAFTYPRIHGLVFDPGTGVLQKVPINFKGEISDLSDTYDLFDVADFTAQYALDNKVPAKK
jgi:carbonic anhydrase